MTVTSSKRVDEQARDCAARGDLSGLGRLLSVLINDADRGAFVAGALWGAIPARRIDVVDLVIDAKLPIVVPDEWLRAAAADGWAGFAERLIELGADVNSRDADDGRTAAFRAAASGAVEVLECLVTHGADLAIPDNSGCLPLHVACQNGHPRVVDFLLKRGIPPGAASAKDGRTALHALVWLRCDEPEPSACCRELVRLLVRSGADVDIRAEDSMTPLHDAASRDHWVLVDELLKAGATVDRRNDAGNTALCLAALHGHARVVNALLRLAADVNVQNQNHLTPLLWGADFPEVVRALLAAGADANHRQPDGTTPLHIAASQGAHESIRLLLDCGADPGLKDEEGLTPQDIALNAGADKCVELLRA